MSKNLPKIPPKAPLEVLRDGAIKATLWENHSENGNYLTATFARTFTKDGKPQDTHTFQGRDLLVVAELAKQAYAIQRSYRALQKEPI